MRNKQIDVLKGIGAILVVIGHIVTGNIKIIIYAFHMPLFFFLSGYVFSDKKKFREYFTSNVKSLLFPFFIFNIISLLFTIDYIHNNSFLNILSNIFYFNSSVAWNSSLWFFVVLFFTKIIFYILKKLCKSTKRLCVCIILILILGITITKFCIWLPFGLKIVPFSLTFMYIGYAAHKIELLEKIKLNWKNIILCFVLTVIFIISSLYNQRVNMSTNIYGNYILYFFNAMCGIYILLILSKPLKNSKILSIYASLSMIMFSTQRIFYKLYPFNMQSHIIESILLTLTIYFVYYIIKSLFRKKVKRSSSV